MYRTVKNSVSITDGKQCQRDGIHGLVDGGEQRQKSDDFLFAPVGEGGSMTYLSRSLEVDLGHQYAPRRTRKQAQQSNWNLTQTEVEEGTHACVGMGQVQHTVLERRSIYIHLPIHVRTQDSSVVRCTHFPSCLVNCQLHDLVITGCSSNTFVFARIQVAHRQLFLAIILPFKSFQEAFPSWATF